MADELTAELVFDAHATLGEGPLWDADAGVLWWVDIEGRRIHRFDPATRQDTSIETVNRKLEFDLYYVRHRRLLLDLKILAATVKVMARGDGAH